VFDHDPVEVLAEPDDAYSRADGGNGVGLTARQIGMPVPVVVHRSPVPRPELESPSVRERPRAARQTMWLFGRLQIRANKVGVIPAGDQLVRVARVVNDHPYRISAGIARKIRDRDGAELHKRSIESVFAEGV
jgi:hypothetical protein